jgi:hypothetical protein
MRCWDLKLTFHSIFLKMHYFPLSLFPFSPSSCFFYFIWIFRILHFFFLLIVNFFKCIFFF